MGRKTYISDSDRKLIPYETTDFSAAVVKGETPNNGLSDAYDVVIYPDEITGRGAIGGGSVLYTSIPIPPIDEKTGFIASKTDDIVTLSSGTITEGDISNYFVFPGTPDTHYEMVEYISDTQIRTHTDGNHVSTSGCYIRGKTNLMVWHKIVRKWVFMWGQQIYVAKYDIKELTRCRIISRDLPNNAISGYDDLDSFAALIFNSNGMFRIDFERETPVVYKINVPIPNYAIADIIKTGTSQFNYHYLYSAAKLFRDGNIINRLTPSRIEQETGTNIWDESYRDYADIFTNEPIGSEVNTYGKLTCAPLANPYDNHGGWAALVNDGSFKISINGTGPYEIVAPFYNVTNMNEVAALIQNSLRDFYPDATCVYSAGRFVLTSGRINGYTISYITAGTAAGTTDISAAMGGTDAEGAIISNPYTKSPLLIGPIYVPNVPNTSPQEYQWHLTHFPVYRCKDLLNRYKINTRADQFNNPNDLIWVDDVRTCAAFYGYCDGAYFIAEQGIFEDADTGCTIELENGTRCEIYEVLNSRIVRINRNYYYSASNMIAAAIGNGRVFRARQVDDIITILGGSTFSSSDARKPMKWASGYWSYAVEYIDETHMRVADFQDKTVMGMTMDPVYRYFYDTVDDETLDSRLTRLKLKQRYWEAMPNGNVGIVTPGLILTAIRGDGTLNYGQLPDTFEYLHGFHDRGYQVTKKINDDIQFMWLFEDVLVIWTSRKTWRWSNGSYQYITNPYTKDAILQIVGLDIADGDRGCFDWGSIEPIGGGKVMLLTTEPGKVGWRSYNGYQYGPDVLESLTGKERIPEIQDLQKATRSVYDGRAGLMLFGRE